MSLRGPHHRRNTRRRALWLFAALLAVSMLATRFQLVAPAALSTGITPVTRAFLTGADNLQAAYDTVMSERDLRGRAAELQRQNDVLRGRNEALTREVERLRQVTRIIATQAPNVLGIASIIKVDPSPLLARLTINRGAAEGVRERMPVTVPAGLVGQVVAVASHEATVLTLADPESAVGVTLEGNRGGRGMAFGAPPDRLRAEFSLNVPLKVGDVLVTSSLGGVFPVGIRVGTIEKVLPLGPNDVSRTAIIRPAVDINAAEDVTVLGGL